MPRKTDWEISFVIEGLKIALQESLHDQRTNADPITLAENNMLVAGYVLDWVAGNPTVGKHDADIHHLLNKIVDVAKLFDPEIN
jgi:hypothetical protein